MISDTDDGSTDRWFKGIGATESKDRSLELKSVFRECLQGPRKIAVKVVDIFGNDTMKIIEVTI